MKFYIASSFANKKAVRALASRLIREGFTQTYKRMTGQKMNARQR
ncbi:hypothetical protein [Thermaerobacillus caldiproteolyticus]|uniref:Uncharacterized protein n=1 Tax=Thermaerobacillus caldiproteolyticus TaxID=247480 RepID=A0A7V9Z7C6_9BACL|nr:hypothetical protein [Anoxybacillus caldiproteolyticus]MBA2875278.1 hypothetical protein [Anoxybacillus caldiproteolyticus]